MGHFGLLYYAKVSVEDVSYSNLAEAEQLSVPGDSTAIFSKESSNIIQFPISFMDFRAYRRFEFPQGEVLPLNGFPALYLSMLISTTVEAPVLDETVRDILQKPGEEIEKAKLQARFLKTRRDLREKIVAYEIPYSVAECLVEVAPNEFKSASYLRGHGNEDEVPDQDPAQDPPVAQHLPPETPDAAAHNENEQSETQPKKSKLSQLEDIAQAEKYTFSETASLLYPGVPLEIARSRMSVCMSKLREKVGRNGFYVPDGRLSRGEIFRILPLEKPTATSVSGMPEASGNPPHDASTDNNLDPETLLLSRPDTPDSVDDEDFFIGEDPEARETASDVEVGLQNLQAGEAALVDSPKDTTTRLTIGQENVADSSPVVDVQEPNKPGFYRLRKKDIRQITSYRPETSALSIHDKRTLAGVLQKGAITIPYEEKQRLDLDKLNKIVLGGTGLSISVVPINDFSEYSALLVNSRRGDEKKTTQLIAARLKYLEYRAKHPPFSASYEHVESGLRVWLTGPSQQMTRPLMLKSRVFDMYGTPQQINKQSPTPETEKPTGEFVITAQEQYRIIQALLKNPVMQVSKLGKLFTESGGLYKKPRNEMDALIKTADKVLNRWGLAIEINDNPEDPNDGSICTLVGYKNTHTAPQLGFVLVDLEAEEAALPPRQRRRQPSHGKLRL